MGTITRGGSFGFHFIKLYMNLHNSDSIYESIDPDDELPSHIILLCHYHQMLHKKFGEIIAEEVKSNMLRGRECNLQPTVSLALVNPRNSCFEKNVSSVTKIIGSICRCDIVGVLFALE